MNRKLPLVLATLAIAACTNDASREPPAPSATDNVTVLPAMTMTTLGRERTIRLYLPPGYAASERRYPVLYMHDGQNLFDAATSYAGEWEVDEALNRLAAEYGLELIVVGIDNGGEKRVAEMSPWAADEVPSPEGDAYLDFVVADLKPAIDANYRTLPGREYTAIMGSSLGGLISHYAMLAHPAVFSKAGMFSPSYWISDEAFESTTSPPLRADARLYLLVGGNEEGSMAEDTERMCAQLRGLGHAEQALNCRVVADGEHHESFWRAELADALLWLFDVPRRAQTAALAGPRP